MPFWQSESVFCVSGVCCEFLECACLSRYKTRGNSRGVAIKFLSLFPKEEEFLYPPLTLLASDGPPTEEDGMRVFDVTPMMS